MLHVLANLSTVANITLMVFCYHDFPPYLNPLAVKPGPAVCCVLSQHLSFNSDWKGSPFDIMMTFLEDSIRTPLGQLLIVSDEQQNLRAIEWEEFGERMHRLLNIHYAAQGYRLRQLDNAGGLSAQLTRYFDGDLSVIRQLPVATNGTAFQRSVWNMLRDIPCGSVMRYGEMAALLGRAGAARAVGAANGSNPISVVVPCHRVIGANGALTGYAGGVSRKQWLLKHEGYLLTR